MTAFNIDGQGVVRAKYQVSETNGIVDGELKDCRESGMREMKCKWEDAYGRGPLKLTFSEDYRQFDGLWRFEGKQEDSPWNGLKQIP